MLPAAIYSLTCFNNTKNASHYDIELVIRFSFFFFFYPLNPAQRFVFLLGNWWLELLNKEQSRLFRSCWPLFSILMTCRWEAVQLRSLTMTSTPFPGDRADGFSSSPRKKTWTGWREILHRACNQPHIIKTEKEKMFLPIWLGYNNSLVT